MTRIAQLRERLLAQAYLFDEPQAYAAGVDDTLAEVNRLLGEEQDVVIDLTTAPDGGRRPLAGAAS